MQFSKVVITLKGKNAGKDIILNRCIFEKGIFSFVGSPQDCGGYSRYFSATQNCEIWMGTPDSGPEVTPEPKPDDKPEITERQSKILDAIQATDTEHWIKDVIPHPPVREIAELLDDSSVTKKEITDVIEHFMEK